MSDRLSVANINVDFLLHMQDVRDVSLKSLRSTIGVIPQETLLFNDTLGYNISYGDLSMPPERVQEVVERAKLANVVRQLPQGMDSIVGERGMKLSGGEKQRGENLDLHCINSLFFIVVYSNT